MTKIDLIIDALQDTDSKWSYRKRGEALAAARELKALKPVAYSYVSNTNKSYGEKVFIDSPDKILMAKNLKYALTPLYTAPPRKEWVGLTNEDWENTPDTGKQGCERDAELFDWVEQTLKDKNT